MWTGLEPGPITRYSDVPRFPSGLPLTPFSVPGEEGVSRFLPPFSCTLTTGRPRGVGFGSSPLFQRGGCGGNSIRAIAKQNRRHPWRRGVILRMRCPGSDAGKSALKIKIVWRAARPFSDIDFAPRRFPTGDSSAREDEMGANVFHAARLWATQMRSAICAFVADPFLRSQKTAVT